MIIRRLAARNVQCRMQNEKCKMIGLRILHFAFFIFHFALTIASTAEEPASLVAREEAALRAAAERVGESVVQIRTIGGLDTVGRTLLANGPTTGLVISPDGYIVSSAFNFVQQPASILVTFASGKQSPAELVATDHSRMLVLLKAAGVDDLAVPEIAPANEIRVGQWAVAVGRTFRSDRTNVSVGIISALGRMFGKVVQTDADVSVANYGGPLVDIRGRVLGVIVPMAPQATSEVAGVEWYDSGIGFAVPLASISERLEQMKKGDDQHSGILGIGLTPKNPHVASAKLATVRPDSPAGKAGLKKGDRIVEIDGKPIHTQTDLRFALGTRYGGDKIIVVFERGSERIDRELALVGELPAFRHAFLGILPLRATGAAPAKDGDPEKKKGDKGDGEESVKEHEDGAENDGEEEAVSGESGIEVRMVYAGSPAEKAGVQAGDQIVRINESPIESIDAAIAELNNAAPGSEVALRLVRDGKPMGMTLMATRLPTSVPSQLPPSYSTSIVDADLVAASEATDKPTDGSQGETIELKLPEFPQKCHIYLPATRKQGPALGLLLWLQAPGKTTADDLIRDWRSICDRDGLILAFPIPAEADRWDRTELEYLGRLLERILSQHKIDPHRVVVYGEEGGGAMAWLMAASGREVVRGVATSAAALPRQLKVPPNEPMLRLAVFAAVPRTGDTSVQIAQGLQKLAEAGYPVTTITNGDAGGQLSTDEREEFARWIDTLDQF
jgi:serine protease Do